MKTYAWRLLRNEVTESESKGSKRENERALASPSSRQSEFRELALTGLYCSVHLASAQFGSGYEPIDSLYSTCCGPASKQHNGIRLVIAACYGPRTKSSTLKSGSPAKRTCSPRVHNGCSILFDSASCAEFHWIMFHSSTSWMTMSSLPLFCGFFGFWNAGMNYDACVLRIEKLGWNGLWYIFVKCWLVMGNQCKVMNLIRSE